MNPSVPSVKMQPIAADIRSTSVTPRRKRMSRNMAPRSFDRVTEGGTSRATSVILVSYSFRKNYLPTDMATTLGIQTRHPLVSKIRLCKRKKAANAVATIVNVAAPSGRDPPLTKRAVFIHK